ncbi:MAG: mRNA-degrading endonuclease [Candidatus Aminicenantes bacterium]|nr:MAG: mRNA-degrading endonuclease [Candidatus Aminicenantes bacterium]
MKQVFFVPERGDVVLVSLPSFSGKGRDARTGPRSTGRRAAVVLSPQSYNQRTGLALVCPITSRITGYPFEVLLPPGLPVAGAMLADQAMCLDWRAHRAEKISSLPSGAVEEALGKLLALLT